MIRTEIKRKNKTSDWNLNFYDSIERIPLNIVNVNNKKDYISSFDNYDEDGNLIKFRYNIDDGEIFELSFTSVQRSSLLDNKDFESSVIISDDIIDALLINEELNTRRFTEKVAYYKSKSSILIFFNGVNFEETEFFKSSSQLYFGLSEKKLKAVLLKGLSPEDIEDFFY